MKIKALFINKRNVYIISLTIFLLIFGFSLACTSKEENSQEAEPEIVLSAEEEKLTEESNVKNQDNFYLEESLAAELTSFSENIFMFDYPSNWKIINEDAIDILFQTSLKGGSRSSFDYIGGVYCGDKWSEDIGEAVFIIFIISDAAFSKTISEEQYNSVKESYESRFGDRLLSIDRIDFNGFESFEIKTIGKSLKTQSWAINATADGRAYMLDLRSKKELYKEYEPLFSAILDSFTISE